LPKRTCDFVDATDNRAGRWKPNSRIQSWIYGLIMLHFGCIFTHGIYYFVDELLFLCVGMWVLGLIGWFWSVINHTRGEWIYTLNLMNYSRRFILLNMFYSPNWNQQSLQNNYMQKKTIWKHAVWFILFTSKWS